MFVSLVRTAILYFMVILAIRIMGKRQVGDMQPGELVVTILISELAAIPIQDLNQPVLTGIISIFTLVILEILISVLCMKFMRIRKVVNGNSAVVIKDGLIDQKLMRRLRITVADLLEVLRGQNVFDIKEVAYAILETNGSLSVLLKSQKQSVKSEDLQINKNPAALPSLVVSDGIIVNDGLKISGASENSIMTILKSQRIELSTVFLMTLDQQGKHVIIKKES